MIKITERMREESPYTAMFCEIINEELSYNPQMSLADFAEWINEAEKEYAERRVKERLERIQKAERKQFEEGI